MSEPNFPWVPLLAEYHTVTLYGQRRRISPEEGDAALGVPHPPCRWCGEALTAHLAQEGEWLCAGARRAYAPAED